ncbi:2-dehydro-3-deoxyphosphooctonate aldolase [Acidobacteria bacterium Mor1]|nr:2-dehydro-3-deoxyphosphooctonate aldolase [Acidobacteria bacterium Mor1]
MSSRPVRIADGLEVGSGAPLLLIAGPDLIESEEHAIKMALALREIAAERNVPLIYKSSFDKANRTSIHSERGPGMEEGLRILQRVREVTELPVTTDFHLPSQAREVARVVDLLQVPAFLCRQTDMLVAAGDTGRAVNVKKGQFLAPGDAEHILGKVRSTGNPSVMLTERGASFGYNNLVVDFRSLSRMRDLGAPVCFDATHSVQLPGGQGASSGGERQFIPMLARAAVAAGVDAVFFEVHDDPANAPCDGPNQIPLQQFPEVVDSLLAIDTALRRRESSD